MTDPIFFCARRQFLADFFAAVFAYVCEHGQSAYFLICGLVLLSGFNLPFSEDLMLITAGAVTSICFPELFVQMYLYIFVACCLAGWEGYWIGRLLGPKLKAFKWLSRALSPARIQKIESFYAKYGILTFIVGRFLPGGVRNAIFMSSGLTKMPFPLFIFRDTIGCLFASATIFYLGYIFGSNYAEASHYFKIYESAFIALMALILLCAAIYAYIYRSKTSSSIGRS